MNPISDKNVMQGRGPYIYTNKGNPFYMFDPREDEVNHVDIAHALSLKCRWNGHIDHFYSVAQHCIEVSKDVKRMGGSITAQFQGLMHDAAEAYLVDMPTPLKLALPDFSKAEDKISEVIAKRYGYPSKMMGIVHSADKINLHREACHLFSKEPSWLSQATSNAIRVQSKKYPFPIPMEPYHAKQEFLKLHRKLWDELIERKDDV